MALPVRLKNVNPPCPLEGETVGNCGKGLQAPSWQPSLSVCLPSPVLTTSLFEEESGFLQQPGRPVVTLRILDKQAETVVSSPYFSLFWRAQRMLWEALQATSKSFVLHPRIIIILLRPLVAILVTAGVWGPEGPVGSR